jgi:spore maturation protein SpmA
VPFVNPCDLPQPDVLHVLLLGLFKMVMIWIEGFLKVHERLALFDALWAKTPPYTDGSFNKISKGY